MSAVLLQSKAEAQAYHKLLVSRLKEQRERRSESLAKKRAIRQASQVSHSALTSYCSVQFQMLQGAEGCIWAC